MILIILSVRQLRACYSFTFCQSAAQMAGREKQIRGAKDNVGVYFD